jgi:hypothetical protein
MVAKIREVFIGRSRSSIINGLAQVELAALERPT